MSRGADRRSPGEGSAALPAAGQSRDIRGEAGGILSPLLWPLCVQDHSLHTGMELGTILPSLSTAMRPGLHKLVRAALARQLLYSEH